MHPNLTVLEQSAQLAQILDESEQRPLLIFKHSYSCGVSAEALDELLLHLSGPHPEARYAMVTVQTHRDISNSIAQRLGVRHETPQALLIREGKVVWSASHFRVNASALEKALQSHLRPPTPTPTPIGS